MDKNQAVIDYLMTCPSISGNPLFFNFANAKEDSKQLITVTDDRSLQTPYVDGSVLKRYTCTIIDHKAIGYNAIVGLAGYQDENVEGMFDVQEILDWVDAQNDIKNFPDFGSNCVVDSISALTETPNLNGTDTTVNPPLAKYSISIRVVYLDNSKKLWI